MIRLVCAIPWLENCFYDAIIIPFAGAGQTTLDLFFVLVSSISLPASFSHIHMMEFEQQTCDKQKFIFEVRISNSVKSFCFVII